MNKEENTQVKISLPLIDTIELARIDNFYNDIVDEYTKAYVREKEQVITQRLMMNLRKENQQLQTEKEQLNSLVNSCQQEIRNLKSTLEEIREKLYIWGEVLHPEFQQDILKIIEESDVNE